ncbi:MAG: hypothetical protein MJE77_40850 [Proteobacteria bacterium]|nr:hypothetical protein [Pseudomonadota bacterium]
MFDVCLITESGWPARTGIPVLLLEPGDLLASPLIQQRVWHLDSWATRVATLLDTPVRASLGRALARDRWRRFAAAWSRQAGA